LKERGTPGEPRRKKKIAESEPKEVKIAEPKEVKIERERDREREKGEESVEVQHHDSCPQTQAGAAGRPGHHAIWALSDSSPMAETSGTDQIANQIRPTTVRWDVMTRGRKQCPGWVGNASSSPEQIDCQIYGEVKLRSATMRGADVPDPDREVTSRFVTGRTRGKGGYNFE